MKKRLILVALSSALAAQQSVAKPQELGLSGSGEAGYSNTTGNTDTEALFASLKSSYTQKTYKLKALIEAQNKKENNIRTQERYVGDFQGNKFFSDYQDAYGFGQFRAENDRFAAINLTTYLLVGLGYNFIQEKDLILTAEAGIGNQSTDYISESTDKDFSQTIGKLYGNFEYGFNPNVRFLQDAAAYAGERQTHYETNTGLKVKLNGHLSMKATFKYRFNDNPADGKKKEDTETLITLVYDF